MQTYEEKMVHSCARALAWPWTPLPHAQSLPSPSTQQQLQAPPLSSSHHDKLPALPVAISAPGNNEGGDQKGFVWLPTPPLVPRPRAIYNAASLAYLGDGIYELYARCHFLCPPQAIDKYNALVMGLVCCEAQDVFLKTLLKDGFLTEEERDVVRWGKNVQTNHKRATKRAGAAVYSRASSLETLIGYLYLSNPGRLQVVMNKLGLTWSSAVDGKNLELKNQLTP